MRKLLPSLVPILFLLSLPSRAADLAGCLAWEIPEGPVARVEVDGATVWPCIPYATNGLIAMWDGIWNSGIGVHDTRAEKPTELVADLPTTLTGTMPVEGNAFLLGSGSLQFSLPAIVPAINEGHATVEIVLAKNGPYVGNAGYIAFGNNTTRGFWTWQNQSFLIYACSYRAAGNTEFTKIQFNPVGTNSVAFQLTSATTNKFFCNGSTAGTFKRNSTGLGDNPDCRIGVLPSYSGRPAVKVFSIRIYDRALSDGEIAHNAAIDAVRFGIVSEAPSAAMLSASSPRTLSALPRLELQSIPAESTILTPGHPAPTPY